MTVEQIVGWICAGPVGYAIAGGVGGFMIDTLHKGFVEFPQKIQFNGHCGYTTGFLAAIIAGVFAGIMADNSMIFSFFAGAGLGGIATGAATVMKKRREVRTECVEPNEPEKEKETDVDVNVKTDP